MEKLVFATGNPNKLREMSQLLGKLVGNKYEAVSMKQAGFEDDIEETGMTFAENARIKAEAVCKATGCAAIADDSGLAVEALGGRPGVFSARYGGSTDYETKMKCLLSELDGVPDGERTAAFVTAFCVIYPDGRVFEATGECKGIIVHEPRGASGFGYDPIFYYPPLCKTFAELTAAEKNLVSHRANAFKELISTGAFE